ncbi:MAG: hypothetical protein AAB847_02775 [Patescibacteria group bacterium]
MLWKLYRWHSGLKQLWHFIVSMLMAVAILATVFVASEINKHQENVLIKYSIASVTMLTLITLIVSRMYFAKKVQWKKELDGRETNDFLVRWCVTIISMAAAGIPTWLFLLAKASLQPEEFWEKLALTGLGLFFGGLFQIVLLVIFVVWLFIVWGD